MLFNALKDKILSPCHKRDWNCCPAGVKEAGVKLTQYNEELASVCELGTSKKPIRQYPARLLGWVIAILSLTASGGAYAGCTILHSGFMTDPANQFVGANCPLSGSSLNQWVFSAAYSNASGNLGALMEPSMGLSLCTDATCAATTNDSPSVSLNQTYHFVTTPPIGTAPVRVSGTWSGWAGWTNLTTGPVIVTPSITSVTYDASTGALVVTGANFEAKTGTLNDVTVNKLTLTGEGGATYTLTSTTNVEIDSASQFTVTLSGSDKTHVDGLLNKNGLTAGDTTIAFNLDVADDFIANVTAGDTRDATNAVTVSNYLKSTITSSTYNAATGILAVTGTRLVSKIGASNDVDVSTLTLMGSGGSTYTLTTATDVDISSATSFSLTLSGSDKTNVDALFNKNGTTAIDVTIYNLAAADNWMVAGATNVNIVDSTGNPIAVSSEVVPPNVTAITISGSPAASAALVTFVVSFDESASNITVDDFALTASAANGNIASVSVASGSSVNVTVDSISGQGTLRIDLKANTDIIDASSNGNGTNGYTPAFNSISVHNVDRIAPTISSVTTPNSAHKVGDNVTVSIAAGEADLTLVSGSINGVGVTNFTALAGGNYSATYTIVDGGTDVAPGSPLPVNFILKDSSNNNSVTYTTPINQVNDALYANLPDINLTSSSGTIAEDGGSATLTGTISGSLNNQWPTAITVNLAYTGTATPGTDFTKSDNFIISALSTTGSTTVTGVADLHYDATSAESIIVDISSLSLGNEGLVNQQTINITDAESAPTVTLATGNTSIAENGGSSGITATLSHPTYADVTVSLAYSGAAISGDTDYNTPSSSITINALSLNNTAVTGITAVDDATPDGNLDIIIDVDSVIGGSASESGTQQQTITIIDDDDNTPPTLTGSTPGHNSVNIAITTPVVSLTFDENVKMGSGNISLILLSDSSVVQALAINGAGVTIVNKVVSANFSTTLLPQGQYGVRVDNTALTDIAGNAYPGLVETALSFTTANLAPTTVNDTASVNEDSSVPIVVLDNDSDSEGFLQLASTTIVTDAAHGQTSVNTSNGIITYTPSANYNGSDSFTYTVADQQGAISVPATVTITVNGINDLPVAANDLVSTAEDTAITFSILGNDSDIDTSGKVAINTIDSSTVNIISTTKSGGLTLVTPAMAASDSSLSEGQVIYSPNADFNGTDSFTYTVSDTLGGVSNTATATINVTGTNDTPVANSDSAQTDEDTAVVIDVLSNDSDVENGLDSTTVKAVSVPSHGDISIDSSTGKITYTPAANFHGSDSFSYSVKDTDDATSNAATVSLAINSINDAPVASDNTVVLLEDSTHLINALGNDSDVDMVLDSGHSIDPTTVVIVSQPSSGQVSVDSISGEISYTPTANFNGSDSFTYTVKDSANLVSNIATITFTIENVNDAPEIAAIADNTIAEDGEFSYSLDSSLFTDVDSGDTLTVTVEGLPQWLSFDSDSLTFSGIPSNDDVGEISLAVIVTDGHGDPVSQQLTLTVSNVNDAPLALNDTVNRDNWLAFDINVLANDSDVDGDDLIILAASVGSGTVTWTDTLLTYTPANGFNGSAVIEYQISDNLGGVDSALVFVDINVPDSDFPVIIVPQDIAVDADALSTKVDIGVATAHDSAGKALAVSLVTGTTFFKPGVTTAFWQATDNDGLTSVVSQLVKVNPLVSLEKDQRVIEGYSVTVDIHLNGLSPVYPLSLPYRVYGSAEQGADHDLADGVVVIESGTQGVIRFKVAADDVFEGEETVVIELSEEINRGDKAVHTVTISEENISPKVEISVNQAGNERFVVNLDDGTIVVAADIIHPDPNNQYSYQWSNAELLLTDSDNLASSFSFEPTGLALGIYHIELVVTDLDDPTFWGSEQITILLEQSPIVLSENDSDGDGIPDNIEGLGDDDRDGIPNYLDLIAECNVVPESLASPDDFLLEGDPGVCLRLGDLALRGTSGGTRIVDGVNDDADTTNIGGIFDFIAYGLPVAGQAYRIVLPQVQPVPANAIYRKTTSEGVWTNFVENSSDQLWSTTGELGYCPPPGDEKWVPGLVEGSWCIQLVISDGGPNDADGVANNTIVDPGGVAVVITNNNQPVAQGDIAKTRINMPLTINVLANDSDTDGNELVINSANAVFGSVSVVDNQLYYQPTADFFGTETIIYGVSDGQGGSSSATLIVTVLPNELPVASDDVAENISGQSVIIDVLSNDSDPEGDSIMVIMAVAQNGSVTINADNTLSYVANSGFSGTDTISYRIRDALGAEASGGVKVTVRATVDLKTSGGGSLFWLLFASLGLLSYRSIVNKLKGTR